jgi:DNA-binding transcriptional MerR regulator
MVTYTIIELAEEVKKRSLDLGKNPIRTIRYYISEGLLKKPKIIQSGKKRVSCFGEEHLYGLYHIDFYKKKGMTLQEIKNKMSEKIYWSDKVLQYIEKYRNDIPETNFFKGKPITNEEVAFLFSKLMDNVKEGKHEGIDIEFFKTMICDDKGDIVQLPLIDYS